MIERIFVLRLVAFDWNCPQHITARHSDEEVIEGVRPLQVRLQELQAENAALRARLAQSGE